MVLVNKWWAFIKYQIVKKLIRTKIKKFYKC
jgi:hypothetical protein